jgi:hypothetical protein
MGSVFSCISKWHGTTFFLGDSIAYIVAIVIRRMSVVIEGRRLLWKRKTL